MGIKIKIEEVTSCGMCHWFGDAGGCALGLSNGDCTNPLPSARCIPGFYEVLPVAEVEELRAKFQKIRDFFKFMANSPSGMVAEIDYLLNRYKKSEL